MHRVVLVIMLLLAACWVPGAGARRQRGYDRATPIVAALERFRAERGAYPDSLQKLVPAYLAATALETPQAPMESYPFTYAADSAGYVL